MDIGTLTIAGVGAIPLIMALVELVKRVGVPVAYAPIFSVMFGVIVSAALMGITTDAVVTGLALGLSASGLWSGTKTLMQ